MNENKDSPVTLDGIPIFHLSYPLIGERMKQLVEKAGPGHIRECSTTFSSDNGLRLDMSIEFVAPSRPQIVTYTTLEGIEASYGKPNWSEVPRYIATPTIKNPCKELLKPKARACY